MAKLGKGLDLSAVSELSGKSVVPTGIYNVSIASADIKEVGNGHMLKLTFSVLDGEEKGSTPTEDMWVAHSSEKAVKFGLSKLKSILVAGAHKNPNMLKDTDEMLGLKLKISVEEGIQMKDNAPVCDDAGKPYRENTYKGFFKYEAGVTPANEVAVAAPVVAPTAAPTPAPVQAAPIAAPTPAAAPAAAAAFPWEK